MTEKEGKMVRRGEWPSFSALQREMNRLFGDFWGGEHAALKSPDWFRPNIELRESNGFVDVTAEVPGMEAKDIKVELSTDGTAVTMSGEKKRSSEKRDDNYYYAERSYGSFRRTVPLPCAVVADSVEATCHNGLLTLHMAKLAEQPTKNIQIRQA